jgi:predicted RNA-binding Zn-ribbon protein involved in translation (DUF1610 family)
MGVTKAEFLNGLEGLEDFRSDGWPQPVPPTFRRDGSTRKDKRACHICGKPIANGDCYTAYTCFECLEALAEKAESREVLFGL